MNVLQILQLLPAILAAVRAVEEAVPLSGKGKEKLDMVIESITAANESLSSVVPQITRIVAAAVRLYNATGWGKAG